MISFSITSNTLHLTSDSSTSTDLKRMYNDATRNRSTVFAAEKVVSMLAQIVSDFAYPSLMDSAVRAAAESGRSITDELQTMRDELAVHSQKAKDEARAYTARNAARQIEVAPTLRASINELHSIDSTAAELKARIAGFEKARQRCVARYQDAGLSDEDIALVTLKPTYEDLAQWQRELDLTERREIALNNFIRSAPEYDLSLLEGDSVTNAPTEV